MSAFGTKRTINAARIIRRFRDRTLSHRTISH